LHTLPLVSFDVSKLSQRCAPRFDAAHSLLKLFTLEHLQVELQFNLDVQGNLLTVMKVE
jgi:hypothetical protein